MRQSVTSSSLVANRRNHPRYAVSRVSHLARVHDINPHEFVRAGLIEVAPFGAKLLLEEAVISGEVVSLQVTDPRGPNLMVNAEICWVAADQEGYMVGCEFRRELSRDELRSLRSAD